MNELILQPDSSLALPLEALASEARTIIAEGIPPNTRRTYQSQWTMFVSWCRQHALCALPAAPETLVLYLTSRAKEVKVASLQVALAAITVAHREAGHTDWSAGDLPGVRMFMRGLRRTKGTEPEKKEAFRLEDLARGLPKGDSDKAIMERAVLLLGFFSAMRRSELVQLTPRDVKPIPTGLRIYIRQSKTDQDAKGQVISIPALDDVPDVCPVRALNAWLEKRTNSDRIFPITAQTIANIVKRAAEKAGFDPDDFGAHSLRSGFATSAAEVQTNERDIMRVTRHRSERTVREYIHEAELGQHHPGAAIADKFRSS